MGLRPGPLRHRHLQNRHQPGQRCGPGLVGRTTTTAAEHGGPIANEKPTKINEGSEQLNTTRPEPEPRIYVASLSDYNAGRLHGTWLDASVDPGELHADITSMLQTSPEPGAEEWAIHDHEHFGGWHPSEYEDLETITRVARAIVAHGTDVGEWVEYLGQADPDDIDRFTDAYQGRHPNLETWVETVIDNVNPTWTVEPESWTRYVRLDAEQLGRDLEIDHYIINNPDGTITVFDPNVT